MANAQALDPSAGIRNYMDFIGQVPNTNPDPAHYEIQVTVTPAQKARYERRFATENAAQAAVYWRGLNIGNGYRARMLLNDKVIARKS